ncbi:MAG: 50S ribosomal protein L4 [Clostridia bacterium]|nr:50S ribosomal protein L4 [Clostridia bacterium]
MPNIDVLDMQGKKVDSMELSEEIFAVEVNVPAMHLVVRSILANKRQGTQSALTRGMVRGGGRKIYRQKGTGNARHHGNRAPQFRHGGVVFAPQPRDYVVNVPKKVRRLAMKSALTAQFNEGNIIVVDQITLADAKTKLMAEVLKNLGAEKKALLVLDGRDETVIRASKNIPTVKDAYVNTINVYDLLNADKIIVLKAAMESIQEVYA